ncbi:MAG TPA: peptidylprolyl isomerase, partial [Candidatus Phocaeicola gallinarum]|nr:peptidylprolyl isomerase [Candidatus Phocaeicola gallinarum]
MTRLYVCLYLCLAGVFIAHAQNNVIDEVVWVVGDEAILKSDVENERLNAQYEGRRFDGDPYCVIPEELAVQKLYLHQAEIDSVEVSEQQVIQDVERRTAWLIEQIGSKEKMEEYYNKTSTQIREMLRENVRDGLTMQEMQKKIVGDIKLTPAEVRNYFSKLPQDSIPFVPTQVEVQIITREPKVKEEEIERVKKELRDFTERINKGETTFSTLARLYSEDPGSARRGGEYGFTGRGELTPEFANVVFNLTDPKKISKV